VFHTSQIRSVKDVAEKHLCCGCGACSFASGGKIEMVDDLHNGRRPWVRPEDIAEIEAASILDVCPGVGLEHESNGASGLSELRGEWGPVLGLWEGYATDPDVRFAGSSGGAATALSLYCIELAGMHGVLQTAARPDIPFLNQTVLSRSRAELMGSTGSRYAPASPCDRLDLVERSPGPCVFVGKPCDVAATLKARKLRKELDEKLGLTIAIFCAGTPSTKGTLEMIRRMGVDDPSHVAELRYRGNGWPGKAVATLVNGEEKQEASLSYEESWNEVLSSHAQWRCRVCADHTGEFADIAVGDPWYRPIREGEAGMSLVLARTQRGCDFIQQAIEAGYLKLESRSTEILPASQPNLLQARGAVWGRILACRIMGVAAPRYRHMPMAGLWWHQLTFWEKVRSLLGTARRALSRGLRLRKPVIPHDFETASHCSST